MSRYSQNENDSAKDAIAEIVGLLGEGMFIAACFGTFWGVFYAFSKLDLQAPPEPASITSSKDNSSSEDSPGFTVRTAAESEGYVDGESRRAPVEAWEQEKVLPEVTDKSIDVVVPDSRHVLPEAIPGETLDQRVPPVIEAVTMPLFPLPSSSSQVAKSLPEKAVEATDRDLSVAIPAMSHDDRLDSYRLKSLAIGRGMRVSRYALLSDSCGAIVQTDGVVFDRHTWQRLGYVAIEHSIATGHSSEQERWYQCNQEFESRGIVTALVDSFDMSQACDVKFYVVHEGQPVIVSFFCRFNSGSTPTATENRCWCMVSLLDVVNEKNASYFTLDGEYGVDEVLRRDLAELGYRRELVGRLYEYYVTNLSAKVAANIPDDDFVFPVGYSRR